MRKQNSLPTIAECKAAGTHMARCTGDGYCKVCFDRSPDDQLYTVTFDGQAQVARRYVHLTDKNIHGYARCNANFDDTTKAGTHLFNVKTFEIVQTRQSTIPLPAQTFCPTCVSMMSPAERKYVLAEDPLAASLYATFNGHTRKAGRA